SRSIVFGFLTFRGQEAGKILESLLIDFLQNPRSQKQKWSADLSALLNCQVNSCHFEFNSVTTIARCIVRDSPGHVIVASNYPIKEAAVLILRNDLYTITGTRHVGQSKRATARGNRTV